MWHLRALGSSMQGMPACTHRVGAKGSRSTGALGAQRSVGSEPRALASRCQGSNPTIPGKRLAAFVSPSPTPSPGALRPAGARFRGDTPQLARTGRAGPRRASGPSSHQGSEAGPGKPRPPRPATDPRPRPGRGVHAAPASRGRPHLFLSLPGSVPALNNY